MTPKATAEFWLKPMTARYFVFVRAGKAAVELLGRDVADLDRATTVADLIAGQIEKPLAIWCAEDCRFYDASEEIAQIVADEAASKGLDLPQSTLEFISEHVSLRYAYALGMEAA